MISALLWVGAAASALATPALRAHTQAGPLSGKWSGYVSRETTNGIKRTHIVITVNDQETAGSWKLSSACYGALTLDSISDGFHHYLRHRGAGATCSGGDVDCLKRIGSGLYDSVTARAGSVWDTSGLLKRTRT